MLPSRRPFFHLRKRDVASGKSQVASRKIEQGGASKVCFVGEKRGGMYLWGSCELRCVYATAGILNGTIPAREYKYILRESKKGKKWLADRGPMEPMGWMKDDLMGAESESVGESIEEFERRPLYGLGWVRVILIGVEYTYSTAYIYCIYCIYIYRLYRLHIARSTV